MIEEFFDKLLEKKLTPILEAVKNKHHFNSAHFSDPRIKEVGERVMARLPLNKDQLCIYLGCSIQKVDKLIKNKEITCWHNGRRGDVRFSFETYASLPVKFLRLSKQEKQKQNNSKFQMP